MTAALIAVGGAALVMVCLHALFYSKRKVLTMLTGLGLSLHRLITAQQAEIGALRRENERLWKAVRALAEGEADE